MRKARLLFVAALLCLSGCGANQSSTNAELSVVSFCVENGKTTLSFSNSGFHSFNVYEKSKSQIEYAFKKEIRTNTYTYTNPNLDIKIVPCNKGKEVKDKSLIANYFDHHFNNDSIRVFDQEEDHSSIQKHIDDTYSVLQTDEFSTKRSAMLFLPGDYSDITVKNGYYTSISGLGKAPLDVVVEKVEVKNHPNTKNALINFWRSIENFHAKEDSMWATSQAAPLRRMSFAKNLHLSDYEDEAQNYSSGGFMANSYVGGLINNGSQQQYYFRNDRFGAYSSSNFNTVLEGCLGSVPFTTWQETHATIIKQTEDVMDKPNIVYDKNKGLGVNVYKKVNATSSYSWGDLNKEDATFVPIDDFYFVNPRNKAVDINRAIKDGKHIMFTPGIYDIDDVIEIDRDGTIVYGMGLATLRCKNEDTIFRVNNVSTNISGLILQSGESSSSLLELNGDSNPTNSYLGDVFFRTGGEDENDTFTETCLVVNQNNAILDHIWVWRADHGENIGWNKNIGHQGVVVNGDNNIFHCLMVEHYEKYQTTINGEFNKVIFYQSETPYDALEQEDWTRGLEEKDRGYASYYVEDDVKNHYAIGLGVYFHSIAKTPIYCNSAYEAPKSENIIMKNMVVRHFGGDGGFVHFINEEDGINEPSWNDKCFMIEEFK